MLDGRADFFRVGEDDIATIAHPGQRSERINILSIWVSWISLTNYIEGGSLRSVNKAGAIPDSRSRTHQFHPYSRADMRHFIQAELEPLPTDGHLDHLAEAVLTNAYWRLLRIVSISLPPDKASSLVAAFGRRAPSVIELVREALSTIAQRSSVSQAERLERLRACIEEMRRAKRDPTVDAVEHQAKLLVEDAQMVRALDGYFKRKKSDQRGLRSVAFRKSFDGAPLAMKLDVARAVASEALARLEKRQAVSAEYSRQIRDILLRPEKDWGTVVAVAAVLPDLQERLIELQGKVPPLPDVLKLANGLMMAVNWLTKADVDPYS